MKDAFYITVNTLQLSEHAPVPGWLGDCGVRVMLYARPVYDASCLLVLVVR